MNNKLEKLRPASLACSGIVEPLTTISYICISGIAVENIIVDFLPFFYRLQYPRFACAQKTNWASGKDYIDSP